MRSRAGCNIEAGRDMACALSRRDGRVAEGARLESVYTGNRIVGSNPTPSARCLVRGHSPPVAAAHLIRC